MLLKLMDTSTFNKIRGELLKTQSKTKFTSKSVREGVTSLHYAFVNTFNSFAPQSLLLSGFNSPNVDLQ